MRQLHLLPILAGALLAMGCAAPEIRPVAGDVYVISSSASRYSTGKREDLIRQANAYAESHGKVAVAVPQAGTLSGIDRGGVVEYRFRLVDKDGNEVQAAALPPRPETASPKAEMVIVAAPPVKGAKQAPQPEVKPDLYSELIKLDDLRKRGILTEEEFQTQKKKLLGGPMK